MTMHQVDEIARGLATRVRRRQALRDLGGGVLGAGLAWLGIGEARAACKPKGEKCDKNKDCCSKDCKQPANGKKGKCRCLKHGTVCEGLGSEACCSGFCTQNDGPKQRCCVLYDKKCGKDSDCCSNAFGPSACQQGRCCRTAGGNCAFPSGLQYADCCSGLFCDGDNTQQCKALPI